MSRIIADFHIHSKYSYATSKSMGIEALAEWGQLKGISLMGTGDFTHHLWQKELEQFLEPAEPGLFKINDRYEKAIQSRVYTSCRSDQRFLLSAEVSVIFNRVGRCYKVHVIILAPSFEVVSKISEQLAKIGNISSDGRPILSCDIKEIAKIVFDASPDCMIIPAHIWTPHFGLLGSNFGFDSVDACFGEYSQYIYALETGLSSNFAMNAQLSMLDRFALLCNSDAHSVQKLGREANILDVPLSYYDVCDALKLKNNGLKAGIEFFPERGKYYGTGHRKCNVYMTSEEVQRAQGLCVSCRKPLTEGVLCRVQYLADRTEAEAQKYIRSGHKVVPLLDILSHDFGVAATSKRVENKYHELLKTIGSEFFILLEAPIVEIARYGSPVVAEAIAKMRSGTLEVQPGYDGEYGQVYF